MIINHPYVQNEGGSLRRFGLQFGERPAEDVESAAGGGERNDNKEDLGDYPWIEHAKRN